MSNLLHQRLVKIRESVEAISLENKQLRGNNENLTQQNAELQKTIELQKNALYELKEENKMIKLAKESERKAKLAKDKGNKRLSKMCKIISGDEMRHHHAYSEFVERIFSVDPSQMMMAFHDMMKRKIAMPAHFLRESGDEIGTAFEEDPQFFTPC